MISLCLSGVEEILCHSIVGAQLHVGFFKIRFAIREVLDDGVEFDNSVLRHKFSLRSIDLLAELLTVEVLLLNGRLKVVDLDVLGRVHLLKVELVSSQHLSLLKDHLVLLIDGGFLPSREHNDEVHLSESLLSNTL